MSECANLTLAHLDLHTKTLTVSQGKGKKDRRIELEKKSTTALKNYLKVRPKSGAFRILSRSMPVVLALRSGSHPTASVTPLRHTRHDKECLLSSSKSG